MRLLQHPHFRPRHYLGGSAVIFFIVLLYGFSLSAVFSVGSDYALSDFLKDDYLHQVIAFSVGQAFLSALLSSVIGTLFARAFFYLDFKGKSLILRIFSLTFVLPALLAIFGLIGIYGTAGWLVQLLQTLGISWKPSIYGLSGILIAHLFFNIPLAARMSLQALQSVPTEQHQLAAQLNIKGSIFFRLIEWPYLKSQTVSAFVLIFMLCFTSFTIVLALGGGPQNSTLEVAIYQELHFLRLYNLRFVLRYFRFHNIGQKHQKPRFHSVIAGFYLFQVRLNLDMFLSYSRCAYLFSVPYSILFSKVCLLPNYLAIGKIHNYGRRLLIH